MRSIQVVSLAKGLLMDEKNAYVPTFPRSHHILPPFNRWYFFLGGGGLFDPHTGQHCFLFWRRGRSLNGRTSALRGKHLNNLVLRYCLKNSRGLNNSIFSFLIYPSHFSYKKRRSFHPPSILFLLCCSIKYSVHKEDLETNRLFYLTRVVL